MKPVMGEEWHLEKDCSGTGDEAGSRPSAPAPSGEPVDDSLRRMLGEALGNVKTMQYTLQEIYEYCKDYADAPTSTPQTALGVVRGAQEKAWRELQGKTVIPESSPLDLKDAARKWFKEFADEIEDVDVRHLFLACDDDVVNMLAAFAEHLREGR